MNNEVLKDICVLDLCTRLPGPFATMILSRMGAEVIKCENTHPFNDPFTHDEIKDIAPNFESWYKNLNKGKEIISFDFKTHKERLQKLIKKADIILCPASNYFDKLKAQGYFENKILINLAAGKGENSSAHDLNILGLTQSFKAHLSQVKAPPYLPFAGIAFAQYISTFALAALIKKEVKQYTVYMSDVVPELFNTLDFPSFEPAKKYLHSGAFPAYNVYSSKDSRNICLAAIEEKFWSKFCTLFDLKLTLEERFDTSGHVYAMIENMFSKLTSNEIQDIIKTESICLTIN